MPYQKHLPEQNIRAEYLTGITDAMVYHDEKTVVTYADSAPNTYWGIRQMYLREFLLS